MQLFSGWSHCGCLAVFPRLEGRNQMISTLRFLGYWVALIINRYLIGCKSTIIIELGG
jgi:hypothetical protein